MHFEQTCEKKFNRVINRHSAVCNEELGAGRYANYYADNGYGELVARIGQSLSVFEIAIHAE